MTTCPVFGGVDPSTKGYNVALLSGPCIQTLEAVDLPAALAFLAPAHSVCVETPSSAYAGNPKDLMATMFAAGELLGRLHPLGFRASVQQIREPALAELEQLQLAERKHIKGDVATALWLREVYLPGVGIAPDAVATLFDERGPRNRKIGVLSSDHKIDALMAAVYAARQCAQDGRPLTNSSADKEE